MSHQTLLIGCRIQNNEKLTREKFENWELIILSVAPVVSSLVSVSRLAQYCRHFKALYCLALCEDSNHCYKCQLYNVSFNLGYIVQCLYQLTAWRKIKFQWYRELSGQLCVQCQETRKSACYVSNISTSKLFIDGAVDLMYNVHCTYQHTWLHLELFDKGVNIHHTLLTKSIAGRSCIQLVKEAKLNT